MKNATEPGIIWRLPWCKRLGGFELKVPPPGVVRHCKPLHDIKAPVVNEARQIRQEDGEIAVQSVIQAAAHAAEPQSGAGVPRR